MMTLQPQHIDADGNQVYYLMRGISYVATCYFTRVSDQWVIVGAGGLTVFASPDFREIEKWVAGAK